MRYIIVSIIITSISTSVKWSSFVDRQHVWHELICWFLFHDERAIDALCSTSDTPLCIMPTELPHLVHYYQSIVRPVLEYACPVWHSSLSKQMIKSLENVQRRAVQIIAGNTSYTGEASSTLGIQSLADRQSELCRTLFTQIVNNESHSLHYLLPVKRDTQLTGRLRSATTAYPTFRVRTNRFKNSFLPFSISNYQWHLRYFILLCVFFLCLIVNLCVCLYPAYGCHKTINVTYVCMYLTNLSIGSSKIIKNTKEV